MPCSTRPEGRCVIKWSENSKQASGSYTVGEKASRPCTTRASSFLHPTQHNLCCSYFHPSTSTFSVSNYLTSRGLSQQGLLTSINRLLHFRAGRATTWSGEDTVLNPAWISCVNLAAFSAKDLSHSRCLPACAHNTEMKCQSGCCLSQICAAQLCSSRSHVRGDTSQLHLGQGSSAPLLPAQPRYTQLRALPRSCGLSC